MKLEVLNIQGQSTGRQIELPESYFGVEPNAHAVYLAVKQYNAAQRQGTHKAKEKWEISKSTKKLKRQKGTGTARAGSAKSPLFRGGGRVFGPKPHDYYIDVNKKVKFLAKASVLSDKAQKGMLKIVEDFQFEKPSTKAVSYTHLRAHETVLDLVCRLLLEKKKNTNETRNKIETNT